MCQYVYRFDWPDLTSNGTLNITQQVISLHFPQKSDVIPYGLIDKNCLPEVMLTVGNQVLFSYAWLPIASYNDLFKCHDMFNRMANEFLKCNLTKGSNPPPAYVKYYDEHHTFQKTPDYIVSCQESYLQVLIDLKILSSHCSPSRTMPKIEIHIGSYLVFCSNRDLKGLSSVSYTDVLTYILRKMANL